METYQNLKTYRREQRKKFKKGNYYHFALLIEEEIQDNISETFDNIKLSIYSLHELSQKLNLRSISISKTSKINHYSLRRNKINIRFSFCKFTYENNSL